MALTKSDKQDIRVIFNEGLTEVVIPVLDKILDKLDEHSALLEEHSTILEEHSAILGQHSERLTDIDLTVNRIETRQRAEVERVDGHEVRINKLEKIATAL